MVCGLASYTIWQMYSRRKFCMLPWAQNDMKTWLIPSNVDAINVSSASQKPFLIQRRWDLEAEWVSEWVRAREKEKENDFLLMLKKKTKSTRVTTKRGKSLKRLFVHLITNKKFKFSRCFNFHARVICYPTCISSSIELLRLQHPSTLGHMTGTRVCGSSSSRASNNASTVSLIIHCNY